MKRKYAAIYARVSTTDKQTFDRQLNDLYPIIENHGYTRNQILVFAENISGYKSKDDRPKLNELLTAIEASPNDYIIYTSEISRIGRKPTETRQIIDKLTDMGVPVYIQSLNQATLDSTGKRNMIMNIILQVLIEYSNLEAETFKTRSKSGLLTGAKAGRVGGSSNIPYGYKKGDNKMMVIDEEEAIVVRQIFNLYKAGNGVKVISGILNQQGTPTRVNKTHANKIANRKTEKDGSSIRWKDGTILHILTNTIYKGERKFKDIVVDAPAIISSELFNECQQIRLGKTHKNYLTKYTFLFKDLTVCNCGRNYFAKYKPVLHGDKVYICSSRLLAKGNCGNVGINISLLESAIYNEIVNSDAILKYLNNTSEIKTKLKARIEVLVNTIDLAEIELKSKIKETERLLDLYVDGGLAKAKFIEKNGTLEKEINNLNVRIDQLKLELEQNKSALVSFNSSKTTKKMLLDAKTNRSELAAIYKQFIHKVVINRGDATQVVVGVYLQLNGVLLDNPLMIQLDLGGIRKKPMVFRYKATHVLNEDADEFDYLDWMEIKPENILSVEP